MTREVLIFIDFFPDDFLTGVAELSCEARGAYITFLALFWAKEGRVRDDDQWLARQCNLSTRKFKIIKTELILEKKLILKDGFLYNKRAVITLDVTLERRKKASEKSALAHAARWGKDKSSAFKDENNQSKVEDKLDINQSKIEDKLDINQSKIEDKNKINIEETAENIDSSDAPSNATGNATGNAPSNAPSNASGNASGNAIHKPLATSQQDKALSKPYNNSDKQQQLKQAEKAAAFKFKKKDKDLLKVLIDEGHDFEKDILQIILLVTKRETKKKNKPATMKYFDQAIRDSKINRLANGPAKPITDHKTWSLEEWCKHLNFDLKKGKFNNGFSERYFKTHFPGGTSPKFNFCVAPKELKLAVLKAWGVKPLDY